MNIEYTTLNGICVAELVSESIEISNEQEALDIMMTAAYQGAAALIIQEKHLIPAFFDLKTQIAGDILQKVSTYSFRLAIVGDFSKYTSKSLNDFMLESNKTGRVLFVPSVQEAKEKLTTSIAF
jgi:hypothetical protein